MVSRDRDKKMSASRGKKGSRSARARRKTDKTHHTKYQNAPAVKILVLAAAVILSSFIFIFLSPPDYGKWSVSDSGELSYPLDRGAVEYKEVAPVRVTDNCTVERASYTSKDADVAALIIIPINASGSRKVAGVVLLPGAGVTKEMREDFLLELCSRGYAGIVIDQRGIGETAAPTPDIGDYESFKKGIEPLSYKYVYDALRAYDFLSSRPEVDESEIVMVGESIGGRFAIIAAAVDPSVSGVIGISTAGQNTESLYTQNAEQKKFILSLDPDTYLDMLPPRRLVMMHAAGR